ncbi:MAG: hypothetical protein RLY86_3319 [Pseudomonadota bacterium]|jgi:hypothetical protein
MSRISTALRGVLSVFLLLIGLAGPSLAADADPYQHLRGYIGQTYRGAGADGKPLVDIQRWDWAVAGKAVRITHALEDGSYGGETVVFYDAPSKSLIYHYFTTAGFHTQGTMVASPGTWVAEEAVAGHHTITRVRTTAIRADDGSYTTRSDYLDKDTWVQGHSIAYAPAPGSVVPLPASAP